MDLETLQALRGPDGRRLLDEVSGAYGVEDTIGLGARLRRDHPADLVAAALTQVSLRRQAVVKFGADAERLFLTREGLEQATPRQVAAHRAARIRASGARRVADLCCGIGGDLIALARAGLDLTGVDRDPLTAAIARADLDVLGLGDRAVVRTAEVETVDRTAFDAVVLDPARRNRRGRVFDPEGYSPPWSFVLDVLAGDACVKTAPIVPHDLVPDHVEAEWISVRGEVKEAALWSGTLHSGPSRRATILPADAADTATAPEHDSSVSSVRASSLTSDDDPGEAPVSAPGAFVYEPDGAVIRAGLVTAVAPLIDGALLHPRIAYLTSDRLVPTPFATAYAVNDVLPYDLKRLRRLLRERGVGVLTVKKRGLDLDPDAIRKQLVGKGPATATLIVTRTHTQTVALLVEPVG